LIAPISVASDSKIWSLPGAGRVYKTRERQPSFLRPGAE
jgi:hypothetical protein